MRRQILFLTAFAILRSTSLEAADSPAHSIWGGQADSNMASDATALPSSLEGVTPLWSRTFSTHQYSIPTIVEDRIYVGINDSELDRPGLKPTGGGILACLDRASGETIWQLSSPRFMGGIKPPYHFNKWRSGFCSGPVVEGDRIYVIGGRGEILCLDRGGQADGNDGPFVDELEYMEIDKAVGGELLKSDGDIVWNYNLLEQLDVVPHDVCGSTLLLYGDLLFACTSNGIDDKHNTYSNPDSPCLIALDKKSGRLVATDAECIGRRSFHGHWSSPCLGETKNGPLVFFGGGDGILYAFKPPKSDASEPQALEKAWSHDCNPPDYRVSDGQPMPYFSKGKKTRLGPSEIISSPVFHNGRVYVAIGQSPRYGPGAGNLSCVDAATGEEIWSSQLVDRTLSTVSIVDGLLYIADFSNNIHCFDADTGKRHWTHDLGAGVWQASTFVADGKVYIGTENNQFYIFEAKKEKRLLAQTRVDSPPITPAAVDGILYLPTQKSLTAYPGKK